MPPKQMQTLIFYWLQMSQPQGQRPCDHFWPQTMELKDECIGWMRKKSMNEKTPTFKFCPYMNVCG